MSPAIVIFLASGAVFLALGAEMLVRGAAALAARFGVSSLVIGLTVVAFGTSAPELAVSLRAAVFEQPNVALGNVVGSNIFNILFLLGLCAAITPLSVNRQLVRLDMPLMMGLSGAVLLMALDKVFSRIDGLILFAALLIYVAYSVVKSRRDVQRQPAGALCPPSKHAPGGIWRQILLAVIGLAILTAGSHFFVKGAVRLAQFWGVGDLVIGLTIVAVGTSLPEIATSVVAAIRGERDIAVGNAVGSNIFNLLSVLGLSALVHPLQVAPAALGFDLPVMLAVAIAAYPVFITGFCISRAEGILFLAYYAAYTVYLVLDATAHAALPLYSAFLLKGAIPVTFAALLWLVIIHMKERAASKKKGVLSP